MSNSSSSHHNNKPLPDLSQWSHVHKSTKKPTSSSATTRPHAMSSASFHERQQQNSEPPHLDQQRSLDTSMHSYRSHDSNRSHDSYGQQQQQHPQQQQQLNNYPSTLDSESLAHEGDFLIDDTPTNNALSSHRHNSTNSQRSHDSVYLTDDAHDDELTHHPSSHHHSSSGGGAHRASDDYSDSTLTAHSTMAIPSAAYERVRVPYSDGMSARRRKSDSKEQSSGRRLFNARVRDTCCGLAPLLQSATVRYASVCINLLLCALLLYSHTGGKNWMCHRKYVVMPQQEQQQTALSDSVLSQNAKQLIASLTGAASDEQSSVADAVAPLVSSDKSVDKTEEPAQSLPPPPQSDSNLASNDDKPSLSDSVGSKVQSSKSTTISDAMSKLDTVQFDLSSHNHVWQYCDNWSATPKSILPNAFCSREPQTEQGWQVSNYGGQVNRAVTDGTVRQLRPPRIECVNLPPENFEFPPKYTPLPAQGHVVHWPNLLVKSYSDLPVFNKGTPKNHYHFHAAKYDLDGLGEVASVAPVIPFQSRIRNLLDIGAGGGSLGLVLKRKYDIQTLSIIFPDWPYCEYITDRGNLCVLVDAMDAMPFAKWSWDALHVSWVYHGQQPGELIQMYRELDRILRPGGYFWQRGGWSAVQITAMRWLFKSLGYKALIDRQVAKPAKVSQDVSFGPDLPYTHDWFAVFVKPSTGEAEEESTCKNLSPFETAMEEIKDKSQSKVNKSKSKDKGKDKDSEKSSKSKDADSEKAESSIKERKKPKDSSSDEDAKQSEKSKAAELESKIKQLQAQLAKEKAAKDEAGSIPP